MAEIAAKYNITVYSLKRQMRNSGIGYPSRASAKRAELSDDGKEKLCLSCRKFVPIDECEVEVNRCKLCHKNRQIIRRQKDRNAHKEAWSELRLEVQEAYGSKCACCGESLREFLTVDHIGNWGREHRKEVNGAELYRHLKENGFPKDRFRLLCYNCNCSIGHYGYCPHNPEVKCQTGKEKGIRDRKLAAIAALIRARSASASKKRLERSTRSPFAEVPRG